MRVAVIGRTGMLLETARLLLDAGHSIPIVGTCESEDHYDAGPGDFEDLASSIDAAYFCDGRINAPAIVGKLREAQCDLAVSVNWRTILGREAIGAFPLGVLNGHAGDLPRYRGNACPNWAIINGETRIGLSIHLMLPDELDAGDVLRKAYFELSDSLDITDVYAWLAKETPRQFLAAVEALSNGTAEPVPQSESEGRPLRCYPRRPEDSEIAWTRSAVDIHRLIRASAKPFAGASCQLNGEGRVVIWKAVRYQVAEDWLAVPGQVLFAIEGDPVIACADGMLRLIDVEVDGADSIEDSKKLILRSLRNRLT